MPSLKQIANLGIAVLLFSVLAISFHYHGNMADHPACPVCKLAKSLSAVNKPVSPVLADQRCKTFPGLSACEPQAPLSLALPQSSTPAIFPADEDFPRISTARSIPSRASPIHPQAQSCIA